MKRIRIYGCTNKPNLKNQIRSASECFIQCLIPLKKKYDITITLYKNLLAEEEAYGECWCENKNSFCLRIEKEMEMETIIKTLAHEFVHLKQFAKGELKFLNKHNMWNGRVFCHSSNYNNTPWEKEATEFENLLFESWKQTL